MEDWQLDFEWLRVKHYVKDSLGRDKLPDMNGILFVIGIQELGRWDGEFTKEQKQDLMHIAVCELLSQDGYYEFVGRDEDGWPHYKASTTITTTGAAAQSRLLQQKIIKYFNLPPEE